jgi:hypothetical protein
MADEITNTCSSNCMCSALWVRRSNGIANLRSSNVNAALLLLAYVIGVELCSKCEELFECSATKLDQFPAFDRYDASISLTVMDGFFNDLITVSL